MILNADAGAIPLPDAAVDAVVTDPPYGLSFMGRDWDHGVPGEPFWREIRRVSKPGTPLLAFGGTRTHHRLMCGIEDAGWEIRDCLMWLYGVGFPKSLNFGKSIAPDWQGYGTALKPAWEPVILAMNPLDGTFAENALQHGVAGLNIDGCRIGTVGESFVAPQSDPANRRGRVGKAWQAHSDAERNNRAQRESINRTARLGRWPANVVLDEAAAEMLDEQSGESLSTGGSRGENGRYGRYGPTGAMPHIEPGYGDSGGASRFFYCAKASRAEREAGCESNRHPTVKPIDLLRWLVRLVSPPGDALILDPFCGSGSTGCAAVMEGKRFVGLDTKPKYCRLARARVRHWYGRYQPSLFEGAA